MEKGELRKMFKTRLISGIILVAAALALILAGGKVLWGAMLLISAVGLYEFYKAIRLFWDKIAVIGFVALIAYYVLLLFVAPDRALALMTIGLLVLLMIFLVITYPSYQISQLGTVMFGVFYVPVTLSFIYLTRALPHGKCLVWLIVLASWGCDTLAYCTGMLIGKHKMTPRLSPKKTIEGAVGGVLGAVLLGVIYAAIMKAASPETGANIKWFALICFIGAIISQFGDLAASAIKRSFDIKDYGNLIPGHGGILDRFDSVIITAPVIYFLALYLF